MAFALPDLPYKHNALEPHIDAQTMQIHHGKHHNAYVTNLNNAIKGMPDLEAKTIEALISDLNNVPEKIRMAVLNNGGGHFNHSLFWTVMGPKAGGKPEGELAAAIKDSFVSFDKFREDFANVAATRFGSGWAWLSVKNGGLIVHSTPNQDNPLMDGSGLPILGVDVWEHAYYLKYQNRRNEYLDAWWNTVNWDEVAKLYNAFK